MSRIVSSVTAVVIAAGVLVLTATAPDSALAQAGAAAFTYQGRLSDGSAGVDAPSARIQFTLWNAESGGSQIGSAWVSHPVGITDGIFTTLVDFGSAAFDGDSRWLEISVDVDGGTDYTLMQPRQRVTAAPMAVHALHGGDNPWTITGNNISYTSGNVGVGTGSPTTLFMVGRDLNNNIVPMAHLRTTGSNSTASLRFENGAGNHFNLGITGASDLALGYNANVPLSGDLLRITSTGDVGIGRLSPASKLDVDGTVRMTGFQLGESATSGYVLTTDASGVGTWQPGPTGGGEGYWTGGGGGAIYYNGGNVGIGTSNPAQRLTLGDAADNASYVRFNSAGYAGLLFYNSSADIAGRIVYEHSDNLMRFHTSQGERMRITATGNVGIGTSTPAARLDVNGTAKVNGFQLGTSTTAGHVLTADADGVGTWQPADALTLPYGGTTEYVDGPGIGVTNSAVGGWGVFGLASATTGIGYGLVGIAKGTGATAVLGLADASTGTTYGLHGESRSTSGRGVYGHATATTGQPVAGYFSVASPSGYAGYFDGGRSYFGGDVGVGTASPSSKLDVVGTVRMTGLQLGSSATAGHVLTADADGVGTWQQAAGLTLPYSGTTHHAGRAFEVVTTAEDGRGVVGIAAHPTGNVSGVSGLSSSTGGKGVFGFASAGTGSTIGGYFQNESTSGFGVYGTTTATTGQTIAGYFDCASSEGCAGYFVGGRNYFQRNVGIGELYPDAKLDVRTDTQQGQETQTAIRAVSTRGHGLRIEQAGNSQDVAALSISSSGTEEPLGVDVSVTGSYGKLARYQLTGSGGYFSPAFSVKAETGGRVAEFIGQTAGSTNPALYAEHAAHATGGVAAHFRGNATVTGTLSKGGGSFKIDHPLDPENKYLYHSFVESPDMMNIYNGNTVTDGTGLATVTLPDWFEALNRDFRYQLTVIDETDSDLFVQAKIVRTVENGIFAIRTSAPNVEVSWQVTGIRQDAFANTHRIPVEEDKLPDERGTYLHPEAHGLPDELRVDRRNEESR